MITGFDKTKHLYLSIYLLDINLYENGIKMAQTRVMEKVGHSPTLNTVLMVEETLRDVGEVITLAELKRRLPKQVMHQTLVHVLDYLQLSGKVIIGTKGILWVFADKKELDELIKRGTEI